MILFALIVPAALGVLLLRTLGLRFRDDPIGSFAWACMLGCLALGACTQLGIELRLPPSWLWVVPVGCAAVLAFASRRVATAVDGGETPAVGRAFAVFVAIGVGLCVLVALAGMERPCIEGDEGNIWSLKAKSLLVDWPDRFAAEQVYNLHPDYPQLNPLLQAWTYAVTGVDDFVQFENRWLVQLCDAALFVALAAALRRRLPSLIAASLALLLLCEPEFQSLCRTAYADGMVALGLVVAVDGFLRWRDTGDRRFGWLAGAGLAFALWSKNETMLYLGCAGLAAVLTRRSSGTRSEPGARSGFAMLVPALLVIANTALWNRRFGMKSDLLGANPTGKSMFTLMAEQWRERVPAMGAEALSVVTSLSHAHVVFGLLLLGAIAVPRVARRSPVAMPLLALLGAFVGINVVYVGSFLPLRFHLDTSYTRVTFQLLPAGIVVLGALVSAVVAARGSRHTATRP